jgi:hypothetical protein
MPSLLTLSSDSVGTDATEYDDIEVADAISEIDGDSSSDDEEDFEDSEPEPVAAKNLDAIFQLERQDPKHRMGNYLFILKREYDRKSPKLSFFPWVDAINLIDFKTILGTDIPALKQKPLNWWTEHLQLFQGGIKYKTANALDKYLIHFDGGAIKRRGKVLGSGKWRDTGRVEMFTTKDYQSHWSGSGWAIWVESESKQFLSNRMKVNRFQHSTFLSGKAVQGAGEWWIENGKLLRINGRSGHYKPSLDHLIQALRDLRDKQVMLNDVDVHLWEDGHGSTPGVIVKADALLNQRAPNSMYKVDPNA